MGTSSGNVLHDLNVVHSVAQEFVLNSPIRAEYLGLTVAGEGEYDLWLTDKLWIYDGTGNVLPGAAIENILFHQSLAFPSVLTTQSVALGGLSLDVGAYFLVLSSQAGGQVLVNAGPVPSTFGYTVFNSLESFGNSAEFAPALRYQYQQASSLEFTLDGAPQSVPEPSTLPLMVFSTVLLASFWRTSDRESPLLAK